MAKNLIVIQSQHFYQMTGTGGDDHKLAASFRNCLGLSFGSTKGTYVTYLFENPGKFKDPIALVRYARDNKEQVKLSAKLNGVGLPADKGDIHTLDSTGGWGDQPAHWKTITISKSVGRALKRGKNRLTLVHERDFNWITLDCIFICERADAERIASLDAGGIEKISQRDPVHFDQTTGIFTDSVSQNGVPLGAIGAGKFEMWPDGWFGNLILNNNWDHPVRVSRGSFLSIATHSRGNSAFKLLRLRNGFEYDGVDNVESVRYLGMFPTLDLDTHDADLPVQVNVHAFSPLSPQNLKDSSLPFAQFRVHVKNLSKSQTKFTLSFALENMLGLGGYIKTTKAGRNIIGWDSIAGNTVEPLKVAGAPAILFRTGQKYSTVRKNALGEYAIAAQGPDGVKIEQLSFNALPDKWQLTTPAGQFKKSLTLKKRSPKGIDNKQNHAGLLACSGELAPGESKLIKFSLSWYMPHHVTVMDKRDNGHAFQNHWKNVRQTLAYGMTHAEKIRHDIREWHDAILSSSLPFWLKFKIINGSFPAYHDTIWTRDGRFAVIESPITMAGALGTMDQRMASHGFWTQMFTDLDASELKLFGHCQQTDGRITHFDGNLHQTIGDPNVGYGVTDWPDLSSSWIMQILKLYRWTGDAAFLEALYPGVQRAIAWMNASDTDGDYIPEGGNTYDYEKAPPGMFSYSASCYLGALRAAEALAEIKGDAEFEQLLRERFAHAQKSMIHHLWNGSFFRKFKDLKANVISENSFIASLAGDWLTRLAGVGAIFDFAIVQKNLAHLLKYHLDGFPRVPPMEVTPDGRAANGQAYVHQHEPYLGFESIYAGFVDKGIEVLRRNYDIAWVRNHVGWSMSLNFSVEHGCPYMLPNYMTNTTTWHVFNALGGATLDLPAEAIYLNPKTPAKQDRLQIPLFFPHFWLWLDYSRKTKQATLTVRKVFKSGLRLTKLRKLADDGQQTETALIKPFEIAIGNALQVSI